MGAYIGGVNGVDDAITYSINFRMKHSKKNDGMSDSIFACIW
jgi:hypothetical protein